jgi:glycosyltransferase involved in cell wall biosynthesis
MPNLPLKTVEMLACGLPVIGTRTKGNRILVRNLENGFLIEDRVENLKKMIVRIWKKGIPRDMPKAAIKSVQHLSWEHITKKSLINVYEILSKR